MGSVIAELCKYRNQRIVVNEDSMVVAGNHFIFPSDVESSLIHWERWVDVCFYQQSSTSS